MASPAESNNTANEADKPLLDLEPGVMVKDVAATVAKFANQNKRFKANATMALSIAFYMTLFGLPVFSSNSSYVLFGEKDAVVGSEVVSLCGPNMMGLKVNDGTKKHPLLVNYNRTHIKEGIKPVAWCGFLPGSYFGMWPTVVTTAMFTLFGTTGSTVKNAWQCMCGTFFAVLNTYLMTALYPLGAKDPSYSPAVAWADLVGVLFLFLASKADVNTMMMGMCSTVCLQLHFMDPATGPTVGTYKSFIPFLCWDGETTMNMITNAMGCAIAIVATVLPVPLLNITHVHEDAEEIIRGIDIIFKDSIEYYCSTAPDARRFQIFGKMSAMKGGVGRVSGNLDASFWETFNLGRFSKVRELYRSFNTSVTNTEDVLYAIKAALMQLDFNQHHGNFVKKLKVPLHDLHKSVVDCLKLCTQFCKDGFISEKEKEQIKEAVGTIQKGQEALCKAFEEVANAATEECISPEIASDSLFVFAISQWAYELKDWADDISKFESSWRKRRCCEGDSNICVIMATQTKGLFDPYHMFAKDQLIFFLMNALPILGGYAISMYANGSIFMQWSTIMPATLSLLVSYESGATFFINLQKLMGVTFGRTLPLLVMSVIDFFDCDSYFRFGFHAASIFAFYSMFTFMYYASEQWSTIGIMIAAFGCGTLFRPCESHLELSNTSYAEQYKGIAEVIVAMMMKMASEYIFSPTPPRDIAVQKIETLFSQIEEAFKMISKHEIETPDTGVLAMVEKAKKTLAECEAQAPKTDSKLEMVPGLRTPFKKELYESALAQARLIISDLDMLSLALHGHVSKHVLKHREQDCSGMVDAMKENKGKVEEKKWVQLLTSCEAWSNIDKDILDTISSSFGTCLDVLRHDTEEPLEAENITKLKKMSNLTKLDGLPPFYKEVSKKVADDNEVSKEKNNSDQVTSLPKTRVLLAINALALATTHVSEVAAKSFEHMLYA